MPVSMRAGRSCTWTCPPPRTRPVAGPTEAGPHAGGRVWPVPLPGPADTGRLARSPPAPPPDDVVVREVSVAPAGFDARFSAVGRRYRYRVTDGPADPL